MSSNADLDLLDPPSLAQSLLTAALQRGGALSTAPPSDADADAAATRTALDAVEKTAALLRARLVVDGSVGNSDDGPPPAKRRAVERESAVVAEAGASSSVVAPATTALQPPAAATTAALSSTKTIHTQQPDGTWSSVVVPCKPRFVAVPVGDDATGQAVSMAAGKMNILARLQDELRQEVLSFCQGRATRD